MPPFAIPKIYISRQIEFSLVLYLKLRHFHTQGIRRTLTSATGASLSHRFGTCIFDKSACRQTAIMGRELFVLIIARQSRPSDGKCTQLHAFFCIQKMLGRVCKNEGERSLSIALVLHLETRHFHEYENKTMTRRRPWVAWA